MMPERGFGPPPSEPYYDYVQSMISSAASWSKSRASWLFSQGGQIPSIDDAAALRDSRKNSHFSVATTETSLSDDKTAGHFDMEPEPAELHSVWRGLIHNAGSPTPQYATWDDALEDIDSILEAIQVGGTDIVHSTMAAHAIFLAAGIPAGAASTQKGIKHVHIAIRDCGVLLHVAALRQRPIDKVAKQLGELVHRFVEIARKTDEYPQVNPEFIVKCAASTYVVTELGVFLRETDLATDLVECGSSKDYAHVLALYRACDSSDKEAKFQVADSASVAPLYKACSLPGNDPSVCDAVVDFLQSRINLHMSALDELDNHKAEAALENALEQLTKCASIASQGGQISPAQTSTIFLRSGALRAGTKNALVEQITRHDQRPEIVHPFLITFSAFMTELELLELLEDRFDVKPRAALEGSQLEDWKISVCAPIRARVIAVIRTWLSQYWLTPESCEAPSQRALLKERLEAFALRTDNQPLMSAVEQLLERERRSSSASTIVEEKTTTNSTDDAASNVFSDVELLKLTPAKMAEHITAIKYDLFKLLTHQCLLWRQIGRNKDEHATKLGKYIKFWNEETNWVSNEIIRLDNVDARARRIEYFIEVCDELRKLSNYSSLMAILSAFSTAGLFRLKKTWAQVDPAKVQLLEELKKLMDSSCNFNNYREQLWMVKTPCIPFLGLALMDLQYTYDGNDDYLNGDVHLINFAKWAVIASIIDGVTRFRENPYVLNTDENVKLVLSRAIPSAPHLTDQYEMSLAVEPRVRASRKRMSVQ